MAKTKLFNLDLNGYDAKVYEVLKKDLPVGRVGQFDADTYELLVAGDRNLGKFAEAETMLHEVFHAISAVCLHPDKDLTEDQVLHMAFGLANALKRNPALKDYLWKRLK